MKSPFPGMDPFIEASGRWESFHSRFIAELDRALGPKLPEHYISEVVERCYIDYIDPQGTSAERTIIPDLKVRSTPRFGGGPEPAATAVVEDESSTFIMHGLIETEMREEYIEIRDLDDQSRLVTCVEVLSPTNKRAATAGWYLYQNKRQAFLHGQANLVEIDLLRNGTQMPMVEAWPQNPYHIAILRKETAPRFQIVPAHFHTPLPAIPIPLAGSDPDIWIPLQPLVDAVYALARYHLSLNYRRPLRPPLDAEQAVWLDQQLAKLDR
jgi:hypothetical protein